MGAHSLNILKRDISYFRNGRVPFKMGVISYLEIIISIEMTRIIDLAKTEISTPFIGAKIRYFSARSTRVHPHLTGPHIIQEHNKNSILKYLNRKKGKYKYFNKAILIQIL